MTLTPTVVFDLDGTLVDTATDLMAGLNHVLAVEGIEPVHYDDMTFLVGQGARAMIERGFKLRGRPLPEARLGELLDLFIRHYLDGMPGESLPYAGVVQSLEALKREGFRLAVCTNKLESLALPLLSGLKLDGYFDAIAGGDTFPVRKPDAGHILRTIERAGGKPAASIMIGDSVNDILAAQNAGIPSVAVPFGYSDVPVETLKPTRIIGHFDELTPDLVRTLLQK
ncbi:HAD family hydrolase [Rhizobium sp. C1]|uniref:HAD family hydrolase n=1 Tax=Rhizobium sp. C1 TaxID=1349799 RepID=UPI001E43472F|nr:HAD family hydrolase [Rhizobium sp. C1]MCD2177815.1 phosphoglycolate phosphatase [Rhizobium sp. C1]